MNYLVLVVMGGSYEPVDSMSALIGMAKQKGLLGYLAAALFHTSQASSRLQLWLSQPGYGTPKNAH